MELLKRTPKPSTRLKRGNVVLANAQMIDTTPVKGRLNAFFEVHGRYIEAQAKVEQAEAQEREELNRMQLLDGAQDNAVAALARALQADGEPTRNAFERFADQSPYQIAALPFADEVRAVRALVTTLRRKVGLSPATLEAADKADEAARKVDEALPGWELRRGYLAQARQERDSLIPQWDTAYFSLRYLTKSLVEEHNLYETLFAVPRVASKKTKPAPDAKSAAPPSTETAPSSTPPSA